MLMMVMTQTIPFLFLIFVPCLPFFLLCIRSLEWVCLCGCSTGLLYPISISLFSSLSLSAVFINSGCSSIFGFISNEYENRAATLFDLKCLDTHYYHNRINRLMYTYRPKRSRKNTEELTVFCLFQYTMAEECWK